MGTKVRISFVGAVLGILLVSFGFVYFQVWQYFSGGSLAQVGGGPVLSLNQVFVRNHTSNTLNDIYAIIPVGFSETEVPAAQIDSLGQIPGLRVGNLLTQAIVTSRWNNGAARQAVIRVKVPNLPGNSVQTYTLSFNNTAPQPGFVIHPAVQNALTSGQIKFVVKDAATPANPSDGIYEGVLPALSQLQLMETGPVMQLYKGHLRNMVTVPSLELCPLNPGDSRCSFFEEDVYLTLISNQPHFGLQAVVHNSRKVDEMTRVWQPASASGPGYWRYTPGQPGDVIYETIKLVINTGTQNSNVYVPDLPKLFPSQLNPILGTLTEFVIMPPNAQALLGQSPYNEQPSIATPGFSSAQPPSNYWGKQQRMSVADMTVSLDPAWNNTDRIYGDVVMGGVSLARWNLVYPLIPDPNKIKPNNNFSDDADIFYNYWMNQASTANSHRWGTYSFGFKYGTCPGCKGLKHSIPMNFWKYMFSCGSGYCQDKFIRPWKFFNYGIAHGPTSLTGYIPQNHYPDAQFPLLGAVNNFPDQLGWYTQNIQTPSGFKTDPFGRNISQYCLGGTNYPCTHGWHEPLPSHQVISDDDYDRMFRGDAVAFDLADEYGKWFSTMLRKMGLAQGLGQTRSFAGLLHSTINAFLVNNNSWYAQAVDHGIDVAFSNQDSSTVNTLGIAQGLVNQNPATGGALHPLTGKPLPVNFFYDLYTPSGQSPCNPNIAPSPPETLTGPNCIRSQGWQMDEIMRGLSHAYKYVLTDPFYIQKAETVLSRALNYLMRYDFNSFSEVKNAVTAFSPFWAAVQTGPGTPIYNFWCNGVNDPTWCASPPVNWANIPITEGQGGFSGIPLTVVAPCGSPASPILGCTDNAGYSWTSTPIPLTRYTQHRSYNTLPSGDSVAGICFALAWHQNLPAADRTFYLNRLTSLWQSMVLPKNSSGFFNALMNPQAGGGSSLPEIMGTGIQYEDVACGAKFLSSIPNALESIPTCLDNDGDGITTCAGDCNDGNSSIGPHLIEVQVPNGCFDVNSSGNPIDNDCNILANGNDPSCTGLYQSANLPFCGNGVIDPGEQCDINFYSSGLDPGSYLLSGGQNPCAGGYCVPPGLAGVAQGCTCGQGLASPAPSPSPGVPSCNLSAFPGSGAAPVTGILSWLTSGSPTSCTASGGWSGFKSPTGGSQSYGPINSTTSYNLNCVNTLGSASCGTTVTVTPGVSPSPPPPPSPSPGTLLPPTASPFCSGTTSKATISWLPLGTQGYYVQVDNDANQSNGYWYKSVPGGTSTVVPDGLSAYGGASGPLVFLGGATYYTWIAYPSIGVTAPANFVASSCGGTPSPSPSLPPSPSPSLPPSPSPSPPPGAACNLGPWQNTTPTTSFANGGAHDSASVAWNGYMYLTGGEYGTAAGGLLSYRNRIQRAPINADGTLGSWVDLFPTTLPYGLQDHGVVAYNGYLYITGGVSSTSAGAPIGGAQKKTWYAQILSNGNLGPWQSGPDLDEQRHGFGVAIATPGGSPRLYVMGGTHASNPLSSVEYVTINSNGSLTGDALNTWITTQSLPNTAQYNAGGPNFSVPSGRIYSSGGEDGATGLTTAHVFSAVPQSSGGVAAWVTQTMPYALFDQAMNFIQNTVIVTGGRNQQDNTPPTNGIHDEVYRGLLNSNGTVASWTTSLDLPEPRADHTGVIYNNRLYVIGGRGISNNPPYPTAIWYANVTCGGPSPLPSPSPSPLPSPTPTPTPSPSPSPTPTPLPTISPSAQAPQIIAINPSNILNLETNVLTVNGLNFEPNSIVQANGITYTPAFVQYVNSARLYVVVPIYTPAGNYNVTIVNPSTGLVSNAYLVSVSTPPIQQPNITSISPSTIQNTEPHLLTISGNYFTPSFRVYADMLLYSPSFTLFIDSHTIIVFVPQNVPAATYQVTVGDRLNQVMSNAVPVTVIGPGVQGLGPPYLPISTSIEVEAEQIITPAFPVFPLTDISGPPLTPASLIAIPISPNQIRVFWVNTSKPIDRLVVESSTDGISFQTIYERLPGDFYYKSLGNLIPDTTYYFRIKAVNSFGESPYSNVASARTY